MPDPMAPPTPTFTDYLSGLERPLSVLDTLLDSVRAASVVAYPIRQWYKHRKRNRALEEILGHRESAIGVFMKPKFRHSFAVKTTDLKTGQLGDYERAGIDNNLGGSFAEFILNQLELSGGLGPLKLFLKAPVVGDFVKGRADENDVVRLLTKHYAEGRKAILRSLLDAQQGVFRFDSQDEIAGRAPEGILATGGWLPSEPMKQVLFGTKRSSPITFMLRKRAEVPTEEGTHVIPAQTPLTPEDVDFIRGNEGRDARGNTLAWGIGRVHDRSREFIEWLVEPATYDQALEVVRGSDEVAVEQRRPYKVSGAILAFSKVGGTPTLVAGGDKAPGSAVAAPLDQRFLAKLTQDKRNVERFREVVDDEPNSVVAALEFRFVDRPRRIQWRQRYDYPLWAGLNDWKGFSPPREDKGPVGVHDMRHVDEIVVRQVSTL